MAVENRNFKMVKYLMNNPVEVPDLSIRNKNGETIRQFLERNMHINNQ